MDESVDEGMGVSREEVPVDGRSVVVSALGLRAALAGVCRLLPSNPPQDGQSRGVGLARLTVRLGHLLVLGVDRSGERAVAGRCRVHAYSEGGQEVQVDADWEGTPDWADAWCRRDDLEPLLAALGRMGSKYVRITSLGGVVLMVEEIGTLWPQRITVAGRGEPHSPSRVDAAAMLLRGMVAPVCRAGAMVVDRADLSVMSQVAGAHLDAPVVRVAGVRLLWGSSSYRDRDGVLVEGSRWLGVTQVRGKGGTGAVYDAEETDQPAYAGPFSRPLAAAMLPAVSQPETEQAGDALRDQLVADIEEWLWATTGQGLPDTPDTDAGTDTDGETDAGAGGAGRAGDGVGTPTGQDQAEVDGGGAA